MILLLFGLFFLLLYGILVFYIGQSGWGWMRSRVQNSLSWKIKVLYIVVLTVVATSFITGRLFENVILYFVGSVWMAIFYLLVLLLPLVQLSVWFLRKTQVPKEHLDKWPGMVIVGLVFLLVGYGMYNAYSPTVQTYDVRIMKENPTMEHLNIVMASDMHFGLLFGKDQAKKMVKNINKLEPDIVLLPGDIVDDQINQFINQGIDEILAEIVAPLGVYVSLGNHDKHDGPTDELIETLERGNLRVLYDEVILVNENILLVGRRDRRDAQREEIADLTEGIDLTKTVILMDHQPYDLQIAEQQGIDLMLSGHTHLGQVFPGHLITQRIYENDWGHLQKGQIHSIVSSGFGFWGPPIRIGTRSELVQIEITFGL
ncbi:metallophosphoesterase [Alkalihalobacterium elongatum]|uniref:metallophosphoesterase n=1 Tax=Alkalihalobacterium elongatum TaxID=2675466 RepID=UPI001F3B7A70|nr:metallophosphoesterase [Alkalihalobacterium elongatum]